MTHDDYEGDDACALALSQRGSLNETHQARGRSEFACALALSQRGSLNHRLRNASTRATLCALALSQRGSLNIARTAALGRKLVVRAGFEPARESQP